MDDNAKTPYVGSPAWRETQQRYLRRRAALEMSARAMLLILALGFAANAVSEIARLDVYLTAPLDAPGPFFQALCWTFGLGGFALVTFVSLPLALLLPLSFRAVLSEMQARIQSDYGAIAAGPDELIETLHIVLRHTLRNLGKLGGLGLLDYTSVTRNNSPALQEVDAKTSRSSPTFSLDGLTLWLLKQQGWLMLASVLWYLVTAAMYGPRGAPHAATYACAVRIGQITGLQSLLLLALLFPLGQIRTIAMVDVASEQSAKELLSKGAQS